MRSTTSQIVAQPKTHTVENQLSLPQNQEPARKLLHSLPDNFTQTYPLHDGVAQASYNARC